MLKAFIKECLFFQTDRLKYILIGIWAWFGIMLLVVSIYKIIKTFI